MFSTRGPVPTRGPQQTKQKKGIYKSRYFQNHFKTVISRPGKSVNEQILLKNANGVLMNIHSSGYAKSNLIYLVEIVSKNIYF